MVDVLVLGGGNAALCAALMAREAGASVLLLEAAPRFKGDGSGAGEHGNGNDGRTG